MTDLKTPGIDRAIRAYYRTAAANADIGKPTVASINERDAFVFSNRHGIISIYATLESGRLRRLTEDEYPADLVKAFQP